MAPPGAYDVELLLALLVGVAALATVARLVRVPYPILLGSFRAVVYQSGETAVTAAALLAAAAREEQSDEYHPGAATAPAG